MVSTTSFLSRKCLALKRVTKTDRRRSIGQQPGTKSFVVPRVNRSLCSPIGLNKISIFWRARRGWLFPWRTDPSASRPAPPRSAPPPHRAPPRPDPPLVCRGFGFVRCEVHGVTKRFRVRVTRIWIRQILFECGLCSREKSRAVFKIILTSGTLASRDLKIPNYLSSPKRGRTMRGTGRGGAQRRGERCEAGRGGRGRAGRDGGGSVRPGFNRPSFSPRQ